MGKPHAPIKFTEHDVGNDNLHWSPQTLQILAETAENIQVVYQHIGVEHEIPRLGVCLGSVLRCMIRQRVPKRSSARPRTSISTPLAMSDILTRVSSRDVTRTGVASTNLRRADERDHSEHSLPSGYAPRPDECWAGM